MFINDNKIYYLVRLEPGRAAAEGYTRRPAVAVLHTRSRHIAVTMHLAREEKEIYSYFPSTKRNIKASF